MSADEIFILISSGVSVMRIRERSDLLDLDIFDVGSFRDMTRRTGASGFLLAYGAKKRARKIGSAKKGSVCLDTYKS